MNRRELLRVTAVTMGIGASSSLLLGALSACDAGALPQESIILAEQRALIESLAELIIPETDTPGAMAAGVPDFIDQIVSVWYTDTERQIFLDGLVAINTWSQSNFGADFVGCTLAQQTAALSHFETLANAYKPPPRELFDRNEPENTPFFSKIRELTVFGYYTSEIGATQELSWLPMPGEYRVDYPLSKVGRSWAN